MRIAQVAPLIESVPPSRYGGTERVVHQLTEELVRKGHEVTLFASGDSATSARLIPCCREALRLDPACRNAIFHHIYMLERVVQMARRFDVIHFHLDHFHFPLVRRIRTPSLTTFHNRLDGPDMETFSKEFRDQPVVAISRAHRSQRPNLNWVGVVHHGMDPQTLTPLPEGEGGSGGYLALLGRMSREKGVDTAIEAAARAGLPLRIAAKIGEEDKEYHEAVLEPLLARHGNVEFLGEIGEQDKREFLGRARAMLFPIRWPEPFGLVMIEAMACGTPSIAYGRGAVPEVLEHGRTGFIARDLPSMVRAINRVDQLDRRAIRAQFERRFSVSRMADSYLRIYWRLINRQPNSSRSTTGRNSWKKSSRSRANTMFSPHLH